MGLFDIFKSKKYADSSSIDKDERPYYHEDSYYTFYSYPSTDMATKVITFDERKKTSFPSPNGLYVAEILLLEYCSKGKYPKPKGGYPGLWWFQYGIRDVGHALISLADRGFIILDDKGKYKLTKIGEEELSKNGYVPYMHKSKHATREDSHFNERQFNVWSINKLVHEKNEDWKQIVISEEKRLFNFSNLENELTKKDNSSTEVEEKISPDEMKKYIKTMKVVVKSSANDNTTCFEEAQQGYSFKNCGDVKNALLHLYCSIEKKADMPAVYRDTAILLRKYKLYDEELHIINAGLRNIKKGTTHYENLKERKEKVLLLKEKSKSRG